MTQLNKKFNLPEIQKIMMEFEKQSEMMDMKEEMMNDAIDDAMEDADDEEESDEIVAQVLEEIGINLETSVLLIFYYFIIFTLKFSKNKK